MSLLIKSTCHTQPTGHRATRTTRRSKNDRWMTGRTIAQPTTTTGSTTGTFYQLVQSVTPQSAQLKSTQIKLPRTGWAWKEEQSVSRSDREIPPERSVAKLRVAAAQRTVHDLVLHTRNAHCTVDEDETPAVRSVSVSKWSVFLSSRPVFPSGSCSPPLNDSQSVPGFSYAFQHFLRGTGRRSPKRRTGSPARCNQQDYLLPRSSRAGLCVVASHVFLQTVTAG